MGWKLTKFHQLLHFPPNIRKHGSALNYDGGRPEYYGKYFCKDPATRTQRRQLTLAKQTAERYFETPLVTEAERFLSNSNELIYMDNDQYQYISHTQKDNSMQDLDRNGNYGDAPHEHVLQAKLCQLALDLFVWILSYILLLFFSNLFNTI
jgi:hypothetical protein